MAWRVVKWNNPMVRECLALSLTRDEFYVDMNRNDHKDMPMFLGVTAIDQIARQLGYTRNSDVEAMEAELHILRQAAQRWEQIYDTLGDVGFTMSVGDSAWFDNLKPNISEARGLAKTDFSDEPGSDQQLASTTKIDKPRPSIEGPNDVPNDGSSGDSSEQVNLSL